MRSHELDPRARKILSATHWKNGWIDAAQRQTSADDLAYAKAQGLMFDALSIDHDGLVARVADLVQRTPPHKAAQAFLSSLSSQRLDWRSALASWHFAHTLVPHAYEGTVTTVGHSYVGGVARPHVRHACALCGAQPHYADQDLNVLNFERLRWGGVRHGHWIYTLLDLEQLHTRDVPPPTANDLDLFDRILQLVASSQAQDHPGHLRDRLAGVLQGSKDQRGILIEILAIAGVLRPGTDTNRGGGGRSDWRWVASWRGEDGYDAQAVQRWFGPWMVA